jgi:hypothetical protein
MLLNRFHCYSRNPLVGGFLAFLLMGGYLRNI